MRSMICGHEGDEADQRSGQRRPQAGRRQARQQRQRQQQGGALQIPLLMVPQVEQNRRFTGQFDQRQRRQAPGADAPEVDQLGAQRSAAQGRDAEGAGQNGSQAQPNGRRQRELEAGAAAAPPFALGDVVQHHRAEHRRHADGRGGVAQRFQARRTWRGIQRHRVQRRQQREGGEGDDLPAQPRGSQADEGAPSVLRAPEMHDAGHHGEQAEPQRQHPVKGPQDSSPSHKGSS